jgi:Ca-activated chloride channel family protein
MNTLTFGAPQWFWALLIIPFLVLLFLRAERRGVRQIQEFVSGRLLPRLAGTVNRFRRGLKFALLLCALAFAITALAQPRWGYTYDDTKRKGLDLILAVDTSRSMLSNDLQPNRLERVKLATQDLVNELQGDRVGLIAFAGRAFLQAPLTIDYGAAVEAINDLDTNTIPEGGTNISEAIALAVGTYGKSAVGNRALIIFTDGEELSGDAVRSAKAAANAGVRIFTVGVGTPEGSLIPISGENGGTAFVKDSKGQVVKSKLDETRLREIAEATGGIYLRLENGPGTMKQLIAQGLGKLKAGEIDARLARRPIERYEWPLGAAVVALVASILITDRRRVRAKSSLAVAAPNVFGVAHSLSKNGDGQRPPLQTSRFVVAIGIFFTAATVAHGSAPGLDSYREEKFQDAYQQFQETLKEHPRTHASDKIQFDSGAAAYKMKDYSKALESFSQALLSRDAGLQSDSHYNLGNTLYQRGDIQKADDKKLTDWNNALQHYDETLKLNPQNKEAKENREFVKKKIDELKKKQEQQPTPTPTPSPSPKPNKDEKKQDKQQEQQKDQQKDNQGSGDQQKPEEKKHNSEGKDKSEGSGKDKGEQSKSGESPSPSPGETPSPSPGETPSSSPGPGQSPSPSPSEKSGENSDQTKDQPSPSASSTPDETAGSSPTPSPGEGSESGAGASPSPAPADSPSKKPTGEVKGASGEAPNNSPEPAAQAEEAKEGEMSEKQAERLLQSMKDEERRVQLDERKAARHVYKDW